MTYLELTAYIVSIWLLGAIAFYLVWRDRMPDGAWFQAIVNSLLWPLVLVLIYIWRAK